MKNDETRIVYLDLLRIISAFAVVIIHVCSQTPAWINNDVSNINWIFSDVFDGMSRFSVPVFFMISGYFFLDQGKNISIKSLFFKKILKLFIAYFVWSTIYTALDIFKKETTFSVYEFIKDSLSGNSYHLWYIPAVILLYFLSPVLKEICKTKKTEEYFLGISFAILAMNFSLKFFSPVFVSKFWESAKPEFVTEYVFYFILGHYIGNYDIKIKYRKFIYILGIISTILIIVLTYIKSDTNGYCRLFFDNENILICFQSLTVFLLYKNNISKLKLIENVRIMIINVASLTFGIYLIHPLFLKLINFSHFEKISYVITIPIYGIFIFVLSSAAIYVLKKIPIVKKYII